MTAGKRCYSLHIVKIIIFVLTFYMSFSYQNVFLKKLMFRHTTIFAITEFLGKLLFTHLQNVSNPNPKPRKAK